MESGRYGNASEVVREGLRLMQVRQREERARLRWLRGAVQAGLDELDGGAAREFASTEALEEHVRQIARETLGPGRVAKRRG